MVLFQHLEAIVNTIADPIFVKDRQHRWILLNDAYCRFMGFEREQLIGKSDYDFFPKTEADVFWQKDEYVFTTGQESINDEHFTDASGATHSIATKKCLYASPTGEQYIVGCIRDVTALKGAQRELERANDRLEVLVHARTAELAASNEALLQQVAETQRTADQLRQSQKMEAIGRLAGGIAHDFNNLLNVIIGYAALVSHRADADGAVRESAAQILAAGEKAAALTRQLLAFSRKQVLQPTVLSIDDILATMSKILRSLVGEDVELTVAPGAGLACVKSDRGQIEQVIMNLVANARDAMPQGGKLSIATSTLESTGKVDDDAVEKLPPGQYLALTVTDTGTGMDAETQAHMFEPFFTTKAPGKGTGLGLATVYGIVKQSGGRITVRSRPNEGTMLKIYFPVVAGAPVNATETPPQEDWQGSETILLVEDQRDLRALLGEVLRAKGYGVLDAESGTAAIDIAKRHTGRIDLLITDVVMPGMRGWEVARRLAAIRADLRVLFISGHTDTDLARESDVSICGDALLEKPFRPDVLLNKVRTILSDNQARQTKAS